MRPASRRTQRAGRPFHPRRARVSIPGVVSCQSSRLGSPGRTAVTARDTSSARVLRSWACRLFSRACHALLSRERRSPCKRERRRKRRAPGGTGDPPVARRGSRRAFAAVATASARDSPCGFAARNTSGEPPEATGEPPVPPNARALLHSRHSPFPALPPAKVHDSPLRNR